MQGLSLPATQTVPNYALLAIVYGTLLLLRRQKPHNFLGSYAAVAFLDVEANFLVVRSCPKHYCLGDQLSPGGFAIADADDMHACVMEWRALCGREATPAFLHTQ